LETVIPIVTTTLAVYDRTPAGKRDASERDASERDLRALLEWRQPDA
jgi:hypothetical protein